MARTVFHACVVLDGTGADPSRVDAAVADDIVEIGHDLDGDESVDIDGRGLLPGFIDCHAHVAVNEMRSTDDEAIRSASRNAFASIANLRATLDAGVTTVRDAGSQMPATAMRSRRARFPGHDSSSRSSSSPPQLVRMTRERRRDSTPGSPMRASRVRRPTARSALRAKVRELVHLGADVVKIFATGHWSMGCHGAERSMFRDEERAAIVDEAHRQGVRVMAHAHGAAGAIAGARAGADSIEHGFLDGMTPSKPSLRPGPCSCRRSLRRRGWHPTSSSDTAMSCAGRIVEASGSRWGPTAPEPHGTNLRELELLVACGLTPAEALRSGTGSAAELLGLGDEIGRIAAGRGRTSSSSMETQSMRPA